MKTSELAALAQNKHVASLSCGWNVSVWRFHFLLEQLFYSVDQLLFD